MSTVAIPLTKPAGARPPNVPPTRTSFDPRPDGEGDPIYRRIVESVRRVIDGCRSADKDSAPVFRRLISQRKKVVQAELTMLRLFDSKPLPPPITDFYALDVKDFEGVKYLGLLGELEPAAKPPRLGPDLYAIDFLTAEVDPGAVDVERVYVALLSELDEAENGLTEILDDQTG